MSGRTLPAGVAARIGKAVIDWSWFVRIDVSGIGAFRFTSRGVDYTGNIDGTSQTWLNRGITVGSIDQSDQDTLSVSRIDFQNIDYAFTNWANTPGLRDSPITLWVGWFNPDFSLAGSYKLYDGKVDYGEYSAIAQLTLKPHRTPWSRQVPWQTAPMLGAKLLIPKKNATVAWGTGAGKTIS